MYYVYIISNFRNTVLYIGMTNNIERRLQEHREEPKGFPGRYNCTKLVYLEEFRGPLQAIYREKQLKRWSRKKKEALIKIENPDLLELIP